MGARSSAPRRATDAPGVDGGEEADPAGQAVGAVRDSDRPLGQLGEGRPVAADSTLRYRWPRRRGCASANAPTTSTWPRRSAATGQPQACPTTQSGSVQWRERRRPSAASPASTAPSRGPPPTTVPTPPGSARTGTSRATRSVGSAGDGATVAEGTDRTNPRRIRAHSGSFDVCVTAIGADRRFLWHKHVAVRNRVRRDASRVDRARTARVTRRDGDRGVLPLLAALFFVSGACGLVYQQLWLRELTLVFGVTVHAVSTVLAAFFSGLALGSVFAGRFAHRTGSSAALVRHRRDRDRCARRAARRSRSTWSSASTWRSPMWRPDSRVLLTGVRFVLAFAALIVPATLMGASLPLVMKSSLLRTDRLGERVSVLYGANTTGAICRHDHRRVRADRPLRHHLARSGWRRSPTSSSVWSLSSRPAPRGHRVRRPIS